MTTNDLVISHFNIITTAETPKRQCIMKVNSMFQTGKTSVGVLQTIRKKYNTLDSVRLHKSLHLKRLPIRASYSNALRSRIVITILGL